MELDEIRVKDPTELSEEEGTFLKENMDDLTEEEVDTFSTILADKEEDKEEDKIEDKDEDEEKEVIFKDQDSFNAAVDSRLKELQEEEKQKEEAAKKAEANKDSRLFPEEYKPKDWDEFAKQFLGIVRQDREIYTRQQREKMAEIDKKLDAETEDLRKIDPTIPAVGTKERGDFDKSLAEVMIQNPEIRTITGAYAAYKEKQRGGEKDKEVEKKKVATKVGGSGGSGESSAARPKYTKFSNRSLDDAEEAALEKFKKL